MELGERIKTARIEAGLSQRQLCGEVCTRNMLSMIESGRAKPSMETLRHFARQLGKPLGWFLEEETTVSPNRSVMEKAETAWKNGDFSGGLEILGGYRGPDPAYDAVRYLLEIALLLELADRAVRQGKLPFARGLLDRVARAGESTAYPWDRQRWLLLRFAAGEDARDLAPSLTGMEQRLQLLARAALDSGKPDRAAEYLAAVDQREPKWYLLTGQALLEKKDYAAAASALHAAEEAFPAKCLPALEICYRELGNFEMAYRYACKGRDLRTARNGT